MNIWSNAGVKIMLHVRDCLSKGRCSMQTELRLLLAATVQWLVDNFEPAEGNSIRRSILYNFYLEHCMSLKVEPLNPASFGKLIHSVFLGLKTRRLGTRWVTPRNKRIRVTTMCTSSLQWQLEVPLLRHTGQIVIATSQTNAVRWWSSTVVECSTGYWFLQSG